MKKHLLNNMIGTRLEVIMLMKDRTETYTTLTCSE